MLVKSLIKSKFFLGWVISSDWITDYLCYTIDGGLLLAVYCQETLGRSLSIIFNEFLFKYLKAKCLSSQLMTRRLEITALCMFCAVLSVFVRVVLLPVLINLCHFNTARPHFMLFKTHFLGLYQEVDLITRKSGRETKPYFNYRQRHFHFHKKDKLMVWSNYIRRMKLTSLTKKIKLTWRQRFHNGILTLKWSEMWRVLSHDYAGYENTV